jgi:hypothetical protein
MSITTRPVSDADTEACGRIIYEAFKRFHDRHQFPRDFQTLEDAVQLAGLFVNHPAIFGVVAEIAGRVGTCFRTIRRLCGASPCWRKAQSTMRYGSTCQI